MARLAYRGVLIERPCTFCDLTDNHYDGLCNDGPCRICGVRKRQEGWATHPLEADGQWRSFPSGEAHDWAPHSYMPADVDENLPAFEAIVDAARSLGMPERYTSDLFRDYQLCLQYRDEARFIWVVRQWGTHMIFPSTTGWQGAVHWLQQNEATSQVFSWNGYSLEPVNWETAGAILAVRSTVAA